jgi:ATP-binding cassette, subfamily F, member 3
VRAGAPRGALAVPLIGLSGVAVEFGGSPVLEDVTFTVSRGERWGIVGRNGSGKTTLLNVAAGRLAPTRGSATREAGLRFTLLDQPRDFGEAVTAWEAAASPFAHLLELEHALARHVDALATAGDAATPEMLARYDRDLERFAREGGYEMEARVDAVLDGLGFDHAAARHQRVEHLSGGEAGRVGLARQLVAPADVLLLDEPTNHLDIETTRWLEAYLLGVDATVLVISHDRAFLEAVVDHTLHVDAGTATPYTGSYSAFVVQRAERLLAHERAYATQRRTIAREKDYIRRNIAGQNSRQAKGRRTRLARMPRLSPPPSEEDVMALRLEPAQRGGNQVLVAEDARLEVGGRILLEGFSARIHRGDVVGLVGANGSGKSTLLEAIVGARPLGGGRIRTGESIDVAYYRQDMEQIPEGRTLFDIVADVRPSWDRGQVQGHLGRFGFPGKAVLRTADNLSGGERARVALALLMLSRANFVLLDEPTNHLDVESVEALEDALDGYEGTVLLVSHDRALLRALTTRVWALEGGAITDYPGTFSEWEEARTRRHREARREAAEAEEARREREARAARKDRDREKEVRGRARKLRERAAAAEAEAHRLEARAVALGGALADEALYADAEGVRRAVALKAELAEVERALSAALDAWAEAEEEARASR